MNIVKPSATLVHITPNAEKLIERAARTCYMSEGQITDGSAGILIRKLMARDPPHTSVLEHAAATIRIVCDRGVSHEIVRHRVGVVYSQQSTRYCNFSQARYGNEISVVEPPGLGVVARMIWEGACVYAETAYMGMLQGGYTPQIARSVLPTCLKTEITMTANLQAWRYILRLRLDKAAHPQMREIMEMVQVLLWDECPNVFAEFAVES